jgi:hypothetical protein
VYRVYQLSCLHYSTGSTSAISYFAISIQLELSS